MSISSILPKYKPPDFAVMFLRQVPGAKKNDETSRTHVSGVLVGTRVATALLLQSELSEQYLHRVRLDVMRFAAESSKPFGRTENVEAICIVVEL